jgi:hypothetical protein
LLLFVSRTVDVLKDAYVGTVRMAFPVARRHRHPVDRTILAKVEDDEKDGGGGERVMSESAHWSFGANSF